MDIKSLEYFLAVAREGSFSKAAEYLHMTQPPLSRAIKELEYDLDKQLFVRNHYGVSLTEEGVILRKRAEEIIQMAEKTREEIISHDDDIHGTITIAAGESQGLRFIAKAIKETQKIHPNIHFHLISCYGVDVLQHLDDGSADLGIIFDPTNLDLYDHLLLPHNDKLGLIMRKDHPLASHDVIVPNDLKDVSLMGSKRLFDENGLSGWLGYNPEVLDVRLTYNLINTALLFVEEGIGCAITYMNIVRLPDNLCYRPFSPSLITNMHLIWKKHQILPKHVSIFIEILKKLISE